MNLGFIGAFFAVLASVFLPPGNVEQVYIGWGGLKTLPPTHYRELVDMNVCDNYIIDSKSSESPRFSTLSVRPGETNYLDNQGSAIRGLFVYQTPGGSTNLVMTNKTGVYKAGATGWTILDATATDNPWEGLLYADPNVYHLYLTNGKNYNKKYTNDGLFNMQNQADSVILPGSMTFVQGSLLATAEAATMASLTAGAYVRYLPTGSDTDWNEIVSKESATTVRFNTPFVQASQISRTVEASQRLGISRHIIEYDGHVVLGYVAHPDITTISGIKASHYYILSPYGAVGVCQSFEATAATASSVKLAIWHATGATSGNILIKLKSTITSEAISTITYPVSNLPAVAGTIGTYSFGGVPTTIGGHYYLSIERENDNTSTVYVLQGATYANGQVATTYNDNAFDANWLTGLTTNEIILPYMGETADDYDTDIDSSSPAVNKSDQAYMTIGSWEVSGTTYINKGIIKYPLDLLSVKSNSCSILSAEVTFRDMVLSQSLSIEVYRLKREALPSSASWNFCKLAIPWVLAGASSPANDYYLADAKTYYWAPGSGVGYTTNTIEVSAMVKNFTQELSNNWGFLIKPTNKLTSYSSMHFNTSNTASVNQRPLWKITTKTGSVEPAEDIYFEVMTENANNSKVIYSKGYKPENFPALNTFQVKGRITGLAKSGGYLIAGTTAPDALNFYRSTGDTADGLGIEYVTSVDNITFGSSKSIAYLPKTGAFIFYSGLGVYMQNGLQNTLLSGDIREDAKKFSNFADPLTYYNGFADSMPQATILPTKDIYLLSVPNLTGTNNYIYAYNYANQTWTRWTGLQATALNTVAVSGAEPVLYFGLQNGQVKTQDTTGSTTEEAVLEWYFSGKDLTKDKVLDQVELWGVMDNPLVGSYVTLEVSSTDPGSLKTSTATKKMTVGPFNNLITSANKQFTFFPNYTAKEFKLRLTEKPTQEGTTSWRTIRYKYTVKGGN